jgi:hypothetical protein
MCEVHKGGKETKEELVSACAGTMPYVKIKPMPENFWRFTHPVIQAIRHEQKRPPRNVTGYHVQELPDGCHNCSHLYCGAQPNLECGLACRTTEKPAFCDSVNPLGKCNQWDKFECSDAPEVKPDQVLGSPEELKRICREISENPEPAGPTVIPFVRLVRPT